MKKIISYLINIISYCLLFASYWSLSVYGKFNGDQMLFHLLVPIGKINTQSFAPLLTKVFIPGIICGLITAFLTMKYIKKHHWFLDIFIFCLLTGIGLYNINFYEYINNQINSSKFIEKNYIEPKKVSINFPSKKKNLIYIYLESIETAYLDRKNGGLQSINLLPNLTNIARENHNFSNTNKIGGALPINGTSWTVASMVGQTSGMPLKINTSSNGIIDFNEFFPNSYTLGDILKANGYSNYLLMGSDSTYGGRNTYFEQHGNYKIFDLNSAIAEKRMSKNDIVWWGFDDNNLFKYAKEQLTNISKEGKPFNYTMLTVDTHFEDGYLSSECKKEFDNQYANVIKCSDQKLYDFIEWLKIQPFYENTVIILVGDHPTMDVDFIKTDSKHLRTTYNVIINSEQKEPNLKNRKFTSLDMFPTTLSAMGAEIESDKLGLGTNLYSNRKTLIEEYGYNYCYEELNKRSSFYNNKILQYK